MSEKITNWTSSDDRMIENAIRRGATRRELLQMMLMGGVAAVAGTTILGRATSAVAATPVKEVSSKLQASALQPPIHSILPRLPMQRIMFAAAHSIIA